MKAIAAAILFVLALLPFLIAPWVLLPIAAGVLIALPIYLGTPNSALAKKIVRIVQAVLVGLAVTIVLGFVILTPWRAPNTTVASKANMAVSRLGGDPAKNPSPTLSSLENERLAVRGALQMERQRVTSVSRALALYDVARAEYQNQATVGRPDEKARNCT